MDLEDAREVTTKEGQALASRLGVAFIECSAKTRKNVVQLFTLLVQEMNRFTNSRDEAPKIEKVKISEKSNSGAQSTTSSPKIAKKKSSSGFSCFGRKRSKSEPASELKDIVVKHM
jgi:hypothetical protein